MGIEQRLENWGSVVRDPRWQPQCCASWAKLATAIRDAEANAAPQAMIPRDVADGWLVERAWQKISDQVAKRLLQYHYVHRMPADMVCRILVRKFGASPHTLKHWNVRLTKARAIVARLIEAEAAHAEMAAAVARMTASPVIA